MRYLGLMILCIASWAWADPPPSESAWTSSVHAIKLGMSREEVEKLLAPAKDTGVISMFAGGQLSEYKLGKLPKVTVWYDYTGATKGADDRRHCSHWSQTLTIDRSKVSDCRVIHSNIFGSRR